MIKKEKITQVINDVYEAVENSKVGKIIDNSGKEALIRHIAYETFLNVLSHSLPHNIEGAMEMKEPKEDWKKE